MPFRTRSRTRARPLPRAFLEWQVALRRHTVTERGGAPHAGVAPLVTARHPGLGMGVVSHSIICGLLPAPDRLEETTKAFRELYESGIADGARAVHDRGLAYLRDYYGAVEAFDAESLTTLLPEKLPLVDALRADPRCALVFHVFDLQDRTEIGRLRCLQIDAVAEVLREGPVRDNVWWHNTLFHGPADESVVIHFRSTGARDTRFGALVEVRS